MIPTVSLEADPVSGDPVDPVAARKLPEQPCRYFRMLPIFFDGPTLVMAMADPNDTMAQNVAFALTSDPLEVVMADPTQIDAALDRVWGAAGAITAQPPTEAPQGVEAGRATVPPGLRGGFLVERGLVSESELTDALEEQSRTGRPLGDILRDEGGVSEVDFATALADQLRVPLVDLDGIEPTPEALAVLPEAIQREARCVPLEVDDEALYVAITDPLDDETLAAIHRLTDLQIRIHVVTPSDLSGLLRRSEPETHVATPSEGFAPSRRRGVLSGGQRLFAIVFVLVSVAGLAIDTLTTGIVLVALCAVRYLLTSLYRFKLFLESLAERGELDPTAD